MIKLINVYKDSRRLELIEKNLGVENDNKFDKLRFKFDNFVDGEARLITDLKDKNGDNLFFCLEKNIEEKSYELEIKREMLIKKNFVFQLKIICDNDVVWHSLQSIFTVPKSLIAGSGEAPDSVGNWLINADLHIIEIDKNEGVRVDNEKLRLEAEDLRKQEEKKRVAAENKRKEYIDGIKQEKEEGKLNGATFTPEVDSEGNLSWTNNKELSNPETVNIKGPKGDKGDCNFATFEVVDGKLIMRKTEDMLIDFKLEGNRLKVII